MFNPNKNLQSPNNGQDSTAQNPNQAPIQAPTPDDIRELFSFFNQPQKAPQSPNKPKPSPNKGKASPEQTKEIKGKLGHKIRLTLTVLAMSGGVTIAGFAAFNQPGSKNSQPTKQSLATESFTTSPTAEAASGTEDYDEFAAMGFEQWGETTGANVLTGYEVLDSTIDGSYQQYDNIGCYNSEGKVSDHAVGNPDKVLEAMGINPDEATAEQRGDVQEYFAYCMEEPAASVAIAGNFVGFEGLTQEQAEDKIHNMTPEEKLAFQAQEKTFFDATSYHYETGKGLYRNQSIVDDNGNKYTKFVESDLTGKEILVGETKLSDDAVMYWMSKEDCGNNEDQIVIVSSDGSSHTVSISGGGNSTTETETTETETTETETTQTETPPSETPPSETPPSETPPETNSSKNETAEAQNAGDRASQQSQEAPKTTVEEDRAGVADVEQQKQQEAAAKAEAERKAAEQAEAERKTAEEAEQRRQQEEAAAAKQAEEQQQAEEKRRQEAEAAEAKAREEAEAAARAAAEKEAAEKAEQEAARKAQEEANKREADKQESAKEAAEAGASERANLEI